MSNPGTSPTPRPDALKKLAQLRIERLKKEEEEEQWISGEELYTEGSSDEDDMALRAKRKSNERGLKKSSRCAVSKSKRQIREEHKKPQSHLSPPQFNLTACPEKNEVEEKTTVDSGKDEKCVQKFCSELDPKGLTGDTLASSSSIQDDEIQAEISWRPKRGLEIKSFTPVVDADQAYCTMIERVKKLQGLLVSECSIFSSMIEDKESNYFRQKNGIIKTNDNTDLCKLLTSDWHFLYERCDVKSALTNVNILDRLLEIIEYKQKEAHEETLNVQLQIRDELSQFIASHEPTDEVIKNINSFLQLCLLAEHKENLEDIKTLSMGKDTQETQCCINYTDQYMEQPKYSKCMEHTYAVELTKFNKSFNIQNEVYEYKVSVSEDEKHDILENTEDSEEVIPLTEDEKERLDLLLDDSSEFELLESHTYHDNSSGNPIYDCFETKNYEGYAFTHEAKKTLEQINEKLQVFSKTHYDNKMHCQESSHSYTSCEQDRKKCEENN